MVRGFAMESQDKRMCKTECKTESGFSGVSVDYNHNHRVYDEDCFGDILNMFDFPMEGLEGDGFAEDWASKLGPIPTEVFKELGVNNGFGSSTDMPFEYPVLNSRASVCQPKKEAFEAPSPNSVLETRTSSSNSKPVSVGIELSIPVRTRSKRFRPITNPWLRSSLIVKETKRKTPCPSPIPIPDFNRRSNVMGIKKCAHCEITETPQWREGPMGPKTLCNACGVRYRSGRLSPDYRPATSPNPWLQSSPIVKETKRKTPCPSPIPIPEVIKRPNVVGIKKCAHCEITKTPQWREGPMGPKTLCNACGVRYRSGRLFPEYRPAASPTFVPALHSNSHRKVIEMRRKGVDY